MEYFVRVHPYWSIMIEAILVWSWQHQIVLWSMYKANFIMKKSTLITYCFSNHMLPSAFLKLDKIQATLQTFAPLLCLASSSCFALKVFLQSQQSFTNFQPAPLLYFFHVTFCLNNLARMILRKKGFWCHQSAGKSSMAMMARAKSHFGWVPCPGVFGKKCYLTFWHLKPLVR